jgi:WD40 repeat protein
MAWPNSQDYNEALQNPLTSFSDPELRRGQVVTNALGLPQPCSGNFADVYAVECGGGKTKWAVKCFTRQVSGLSERYSEIGKYLHLAKLPFMVDFKYLEQGIRVRGQWYPILKMEWVEGFVLNAFVRDNLDRKPVLQALGQIWLRMARRLRESYIAHCDLQHGNVMFVPGSTAKSLAIRLIDYDGMCVPSLAGTKSGEIGHPAYQHPERLRTGAYNQEVDRFSLLSIAAALRCLAVGGRSLWERYDNGDNLLFRQADFQSPGDSSLFRELLTIDDAQARLLVQELARACQGPLDAVPLLTDLLPEEKPASKPRTTTAAAAPAAAQGPDWDLAADESSTPAARKRRAAAGKTPGWVWGVLAGVPALLLLGGVLIWALSSKSPSEKPANKPEPQQVRAKPRENKPPRPIERSKPDDPPTPPVKPNPAEVPAPTRPKPEATPARPAEGRVPIPDGPPGQVRRFEGHTDELNGVAFSPDGRHALSAANDGTVRLWDVATGKEVKPLVGHQDQVLCVAFSPDGRLALTGGKDKKARVWNVEKGEVQFTYEGQNDWIRSVAFSSDGKRALTASGGRGNADCTVRVWDVADGRESHVLRGHTVPVNSAVFTPDGRHVVSGSDDMTVRLWDLSNDREMRKYVGHQAGVYCVAVSGDGRVAASAGFDRTVRLWDLESDRELHRLDGHTDLVFSVAFTPDGRRILSGSLDKTLRIWDRESGRKLASLEGDQGGVRCLAISPDGRFALAGSADKLIHLWRLLPADLAESIPYGPLAEVRRFEGHTADVVSVAFSPDGRRALTGGSDNTVRLWDVASGKEIHCLKGHGQMVWSVAFSPNGKEAVSASYDNTVRVWDLDKGEEVQVFRAHANPVRRAVFAPDGRQVFSAGWDRVVRQWTVENVLETRHYDGNRSNIYWMALSPDGKRVLSTGGDHDIHCWDTADGKELEPYKGNTGDVYAIEYSRDGQLVAAAGGEPAIRIWRTAEPAAPRHSLSGHTGPVNAVAFTPDGRRLLSASNDGTVRLWDVVGGKELGHVDSAKGVKITSVAVSPDGHSFLWGGADKLMHLWRLPAPPQDVAASSPPDKPPVAERLPVPDEAIQKKATDEIRDILQDDYKNAQPDALARKLLKRGQSKQEEPGRRFVYLREARDRAVLSGDSVLCFSVIDEMTRVFRVEVWPMKMDAVQNAAKTAGALSANKGVLEMALLLFTEAIRTDEYDSAEQLARVAEAAARKAGASAKLIQALTSEAKRLKTKYAEVKPAVDRLAQDAKDAEANRIVGSFRCFAKADWNRGLPLLALGDDAKLKTLAEKERDAGAASDTRMAVGDGWWALAPSRAKGPERGNIEQHACSWYALALPDALKKNADRMEKNIRLYNRDYPLLAWGHLEIPPPAKAALGSLHIPRDDKSISTREPISGPFEATVLARTSKNDIRFRWARGSCVIFNWADKPAELRVHWPDGNDKAESGSLATTPVKPLQPSRWYLLSWRVTEEGMTVFENGQVVFTEKHKNDLSVKHPVRVHTYDSDIEVLSFTVRPLGKKPN